MLKFTEMLKDTFRDEIGIMVTNIFVDGVFKGLENRIATLERERERDRERGREREREKNDDLEKENTALTARVTDLESQTDKAEPYSRRNCFRIFGYTDKKNEDTTANSRTLGLRLQDIDRSHRIGNPNNTKWTGP